MITANIKNCEKYYGVHKDFKAVFEHLKTIKPGDEKCVISEGNVWVNPPAVANTGGTTFEAHKNFIDIHYICAGKEKFGYADVETLKTTKAYDEKEDYALFEGDINEITLNTGDFIVVFPEDAHVPAMGKIGDDTLIRAVAKIRLDK